MGWTNLGGSADSQFNFMGLISTGEASGDEAGELGRERPAYFAYQRLIAATGAAAAALVGEVEGLASPSIHVAWSDEASVTVDLACPAPSARGVASLLELTRSLLLIHDTGPVVKSAATSCSGAPS